MKKLIFSSMCHGLCCLALLSMTMPASARFIEHKEHHMGPTGIIGVTSKEDIKVTKVEVGSPADGKIQVGDIIVGAGGELFNESNTRKLFAKAVMDAETKEQRGQLVLDLNGGKQVKLKLKVLGSYADTAPFDCPMTDIIIERGAQQMVESGSYGRLHIGLLGLMATGEQRYIDEVKKVIHEEDWAKPDVSPTLSPRGSAWVYGYHLIILCEYHLLTGDRYVLPAIEAYAKTVAMGRDAAGLWGHRMADPEANRGQLHGRLFGYAVMNQSSLPLFLGLMLAEKCGVDDPEVKAAIKQNAEFYHSYVGKGTLPYGVHKPNSKMFNNNGMSALAAVALNLSGDKDGAAFFSRMSVASKDEMELGHTGHYFGQMWTGLGAHVAGPKASSALFNETDWLHTLNRKWDGSFTYDCSGYPQPIYSYRGLSDTGSHLLNYCLGRRQLIITGKELDASIFLNEAETAETIAIADWDMESKSDDELLALFGHPLPKVRMDAIWTLRPRDHKLMTRIVGMLKHHDGFERESVISYFGYECPKEQLLEVEDALAEILRDPKEEMSVRTTVANSLCWLEPEGYEYFDDLLQLVMAEKPSDPLGVLDEDLGRALTILCPNPQDTGLVKDKTLFYAVVNKLLNHKRSSGRGSGTKLASNVPLEDFHYVADNISYIIEDKDLTYHSYHNMGPKTDAIGIFANLNIKGGMDAALATLDDKTGKFGFKARMIMAIMPKYGANAKSVLPQLKAVSPGKFEKNWKKMIASIEEAKETMPMISFEEAKRAGRK